ncbi:hypothetical protein F4801DRAFT_527522 [Xylaria longipes]|nr:hypothetical protein F4801DRAFT_527522 [Xylaria longipes]
MALLPMLNLILLRSPGYRQAALVGGAVPSRWKRSFLICDAYAKYYTRAQLSNSPCCGPALGVAFGGNETDTKQVNIVSLKN